MKLYTVKQLAALSGVSVRALHYYDEIGLLKPAHIGENRYRYYRPEELLRLQQILIHRELGLSLHEIAQLIDRPGFDRLKALNEQKARLQAEAARYAEMIWTIDRTIARLTGESVMQDADLYTGIVDPKKQAEYETWLIERFGPSVQQPIEHSRQQWRAMSQAETDAAMDELRQVEEALAESLRRHVPATSTALDVLLRRHNDWVSACWAKPPTPEAYAGLADTYLAHPDFVARYERIEPGFSTYLAQAMKAWAGRHIS
jgi:MerR family transcriptional regulator, thiopeptide resistance regulator